MSTWSERPAMGAFDYLTAEDLDAILDQLDLVSSPVAWLGSDHPGVASSTTLTATNLARPVKASKAYRARAVLLYSAGTVGDFKPGLTFPAGTTFHRYVLRSLPSGTDINIGDTYYGTDTTMGVLTAPGQTTSSAIVHAVMEAWFTTGVTAGSCTVTYAQAASSATATILRARSNLEVTPVEVV